MSYDYKIKIKEELISQLSIIKALFDRKEITKRDFKIICEDISKNLSIQSMLKKLLI